MPALDAMTGERRAAGVQTPAEMMAVFEAMRRNMEA